MTRPMDEPCEIDVDLGKAIYVKKNCDPFVLALPQVIASSG